MREFAMRISSLLPGIPPSGSSQPARVTRMSSEASKEFVENLRLDFLKSRDCLRNIRALLRELNSSEVPEKSAGLAQLRKGADNMLEPRKSSSSNTIGASSLGVHPRHRWHASRSCAYRKLRPI